MFKKIISSILAIAMIGAMSTSVFAEENAKDYVVTYSAEEITDVDALIDLAIEQKAQEPMGLASRQADDGLSATQLLEVREYADGHSESDYINSVMTIGGRSSYPGNGQDQTGSNGVAAIQQLSYTYYNEMGLDYFQVHYNRAQVMQKDSTVAIELWWQYDVDMTLGQTQTYYNSMTNNASLNTWYTWNINSPKIHVHRVFGGAGGGGNFSTNTGTATTIITCERLR